MDYRKLNEMKVWMTKCWYERWTVQDYWTFELPRHLMASILLKQGWYIHTTHFVNTQHSTITTQTQAYTLQLGLYIPHSW